MSETLLTELKSVFQEGSDAWDESLVLGKAVKNPYDKEIETLEYHAWLKGFISNNKQLVA